VRLFLSAGGVRLCGVAECVGECLKSREDARVDGNRRDKGLGLALMHGRKPLAKEQTEQTSRRTI
jgi:hypothetical protein